MNKWLRGAGLLLLLSLLCTPVLAESIVFEGDRVIIVGNDRYTYTYTGDLDQYTVTITYPDGFTYRKTGDGSGVSMGAWSGNVDAALDINYPESAGYLSEQTLIVAIQDHLRVGHKRTVPVWACLVFVVAGAASAIWPKAAWHIGWGWRYQDAQPSETALQVERVGGSIAAIAGILFLFFG